ncbi:hypothetical protein P3T76_000431 [Phytophthora citrophthora]|uniref:Uncharacterized protein n=1 Tax=Phytophthora citrophthora TaxID=4793 RepID=A0AAD9LTJ4_9STRA|nr:hypothetical protein P3T76_000431 [Phytophthora citrophthora]
MAGRGRGRANTLPAWMTKQGMTGPPPPGPAPGSRPPPSGGDGPPPPPPGRNGQFDDAPEPRGPPVRNDMGEPSGGKRRSRSRGRGNGRNGDFRGPPPMQERPRSRSRDRGNGRDREYRGNGREDAYRRRSRSRDRRDYRGDNRRGGGDRYEDRGYGYRGPREDDYRRNEGRPMRREEEAMERGYRRPTSNGHDDRTTRRYVSDYQP